MFKKSLVFAVAIVASVIAVIVPATANDPDIRGIADNGIATSVVPSDNAVNVRGTLDCTTDINYRIKIDNLGVNTTGLLDCQDGQAKLRQQFEGLTKGDTYSVRVNYRAHGQVVTATQEFTASSRSPIYFGRKYDRLVPLPTPAPANPAPAVAPIEAAPTAPPATAAPVAPAPVAPTPAPDTKTVPPLSLIHI